MKRLCLLLSLCLGAASPASAADDPVARAMKQYERHRYEEGAQDLRQDMHSLPAGKQPVAHLALGMLHLRNAELHRELYQTSLAVNLEYLRRLSSYRGASRSRYSDLYYGEALLESGKADTAVQHFEKFAAAEGVDPKYKAVAEIDLALAAFLKGDRQKAQDLWAGIDAREPEVKTKLAAAWSRAGMSEKNPVALCNEALGALKKNGAPLPLLAVSSALAVYARAGQIEKGAELLKQTDLRSFTYKENAGKSKIISFYDLSLLSALSSFHLQASLASLEKAAADAQLKSTASYYLGEAYALAGNIDLAMKTTALFLASPQAPAQYKNRAMARQAANHHQKGQQTDAYGMWSDLVQKQPGDPEVLADILVACGRLRIDCPKIADQSLAAADKGEGKRFAVLNAGLGRYALGRKDYPKAVSFLEAGRDKGNKNKIESNDPLLLVGLSEAYFRTKKFSEALEIYFEMSKQFPQVRQIQEAMQGVYSMEHKSAGDVKIN